MLTTVAALLMLSGVALYLMTPDERQRLAQRALAAARHAMHVATQPAPRGPFEDFLRARTGRPLVAPALAGVSALVFLFMLLAPGSMSDVETVVRWGGNIAPRTTGGEWWRLVTATFVHGGLLHLLATIAGLIPLGLILERAVGHVAFAAMYVAAGIFGGVVSLWTMDPTDAASGASGAIFGVYGLLAASVVWGVLKGPRVPVPLRLVKQAGAGAAIFFLYNLATDHVGAASEVATLITGFIGGVVLARGVMREKPGVPRAAAVAAATVVLAVVAAVPLRGIVDIRPEIERIAALEEQTAKTYDEAVAKFRRRRITAEELARVIDEAILPELQAARARLAAVRGVPGEQQALVAAAQEYFDLREASWRRRSEGLIDLDDATLRDAERSERAAMEAFLRMRPPS